MVSQLTTTIPASLPDLHWIEELDTSGLQCSKFEGGRFDMGQQSALSRPGMVAAAWCERPTESPSGWSYRSLAYLIVSCRTNDTLLSSSRAEVLYNDHVLK